MERGGFLMGGCSLGRVSPGPRWAVVPVPLEELLGAGTERQCSCRQGATRAEARGAGGALTQQAALGGLSWFA